MKVNIIKSSKEANKDQIELEAILKRVKMCPECGHINSCPSTYIVKPDMDSLEMAHATMTNTKNIYVMKNKCTKCGCEYEVESGPLPPNLTMYDPDPEMDFSSFSFGEY